MTGAGDLGFSYVVRKSGEIVISRDGRPVKSLGKREAGRFLRLLERAGPQEAMARVTGNYKRGNERS
jgi:hypothetical protein